MIVCACMYLCASTHVCACEYIYTCMWTCTHMCMHVCVLYTCMYTWIYIHVHIMCVCTCIMAVFVCLGVRSPHCSFPHTLPTILLRRERVYTSLFVFAVLRKIDLSSLCLRWSNRLYSLDFWREGEKGKFIPTHTCMSCILCVCICGNPGWKSNIIMWRISSAPLSLTCYSVELPVRVGLICTL